MKTLLGFRAPWALAAIAVWLGVMVAAYNWAIPIFGDLRSDDFHGVPDGYSNLGPVTANNPPTLIFAIAVASVVTALLVGMAVLFWRGSHTMRPPLVTALIMVIGIVVWFGLLSWLTAGQPFSWFGPDPPCAPPGEMCDQGPTPAEQVYQQGWLAFAVATPAAGLVVALLQLARTGMPRGSA